MRRSLEVNHHKIGVHVHLKIFEIEVLVRSDHNAPASKIKNYLKFFDAESCTGESKLLLGVDGEKQEPGV